MADDRDFKTEDFTNPVCNSNELPVKFIEFVEWTGEYYIKCHGGWMRKYENQIKATVYTTQQLFEYFLKNIYNK